MSSYFVTMVIIGYMTAQFFRIEAAYKERETISAVVMIFTRLVEGKAK